MDTIGLIKAVKEHPSLYRKNHQNGISIDQKNLIWKEISLKINQPAAKCKAKWRNLRDSYQRSIKWKLELEEVGCLAKYREYKHEAALGFLELSLKRKSTGTDKKRLVKKSRDVHFEPEYIETQEQYSPSAQAVEFLIESTQEGSQQDEDEDVKQEEISYLSNNEYDDHIQEVTEQVEEAANFQIEDQTTYFEAANIETVSSPPEEVSYEHIHVNQSQSKEAFEMDSWMAGIKETLLALPRLERALAKRQINNLVSDFEIKYLESLSNSKL